MGRLWECAGISAIVNVCVSAPLPCPILSASVAVTRSADTPPMLSLPRGKRPRKSGKLNVVEPSPVPNAVLTTANKSAYVVRETAEPSHSKYPDGADDPPYALITPVVSPATSAAAGNSNAVQLPPLDAVSARAKVL